MGHFCLVGLRFGHSFGDCVCFASRQYAILQSLTALPAVSRHWLTVSCIDERGYVASSRGQLPPRHRPIIQAIFDALAIFFGGGFWRHRSYFRNPFKWSTRRGALSSPHWLLSIVFVNSLSFNAPNMAQLVTLTFEFCNRHWGWPIETVCVLLVACRGFLTDCNDFFTFTLASIAEIPS